MDSTLSHSRVLSIAREEEKRENGSVSFFWANVLLFVSQKVRKCEWKHSQQTHRNTFKNVLVCFWIRTLSIVDDLHRDQPMFWNQILWPSTNDDRKWKIWRTKGTAHNPKHTPSCVEHGENKWRRQQWKPGKTYSGRKEFGVSDSKHQRICIQVLKISEQILIVNSMIHPAIQPLCEIKAETLYFISIHCSVIERQNHKNV